MRKLVIPRRAERFVVCVRAQGEVRKIVQIVFQRRDGSLFVTFPYYEHSDGLVSVATLMPEANAVGLAEPGAKVTSHLVKYSHHPDGRAQFSQDGKVHTTIMKQSIPLTRIDGHCFTVQVQGLRSFRALEEGAGAKRSALRRTIVNFDLEGKPEAVKIVGRLYSSESLRRRLDASCAFRVHRMTDPQGNQYDGHLLSAPLGRPGSSRILAVTCEGIASMNTHQPTLLTFIGGFDDPQASNDRTRPTQFLAFMYPSAELEGLLGSIDYSPRE